MRFEIFLAGIIASASAQILETGQDEPSAEVSNLATSLIPAPPVEAQVTDLAAPEIYEELLGPVGGILSAIAHSVETSVLGKVTDVPASELNKLSSSIAAKESDVLGGAISAAAEASATKKQDADRKEEALPVNTGVRISDNDGVGNRDDDKDHDEDREDHDDDHNDHDDDHNYHEDDHKDHDKDHDKDDDRGDDKDDDNDRRQQKQVDEGEDDATGADAAATGDAAEDDAATAGDNVDAGDIVDEANGRVGAETDDKVVDDAEAQSGADEDNITSPESLRKRYSKLSENAAETLVAWSPVICILFGAVVLLL
ncbi:uncharacterized protein H6S33_009271 [Morchella sextelata]|uniref:uncharacterized protein n=1 Tax=Morchella sextelata TaxID=1174677 RepID=UPI001D050161|nr:uncharacterized protein H6S33_009271 [Morchella sextelata]KAH0612891.1 hypothetical protein H6S33_009271 [Morchella sextelata]